MSEDALEQQQETPTIARGPLLIRLLLSVLFAFIFFLLTYVVYILTIWQAVTNLVIASPNANLVEFGGLLRAYLVQIIEYLTFRSDEAPFPFAKWPAENSSEKK